MSYENHIEFMDIDGPEFLNDVNNQIASIRADVEMVDNQTTSTTVRQASIQPWDIEAFSEIAVLDTNFLLSKLGYLDTVLDLANAKPGSILVILPWVVIQELDGLKSRASESVKSSARMAMRFIEMRLKQKMTSLRGQQMDQVYDKTLETSKGKHNVKGDDRILDCCLYFNKISQKPVSLLSNDRNLCIKAMIHHIETVSAESIPRLEAFLNKFAQNSSLSNTAPSSANPMPTISLYDKQPETINLSLYEQQPHTINLSLSTFSQQSAAQAQQQIDDYSMDIDDDDDDDNHHFAQQQQQFHMTTSTTNTTTADDDWLRNPKGTAYSKWANAPTRKYDPYLRKKYHIDEGPACLDNDPTLTAPKRPYRPNHVSYLNYRP